MGDGRPSGNGSSTRHEWDGYGYPLTGDGKGGHLGRLQPLGPEGQRWGCRNAETGETVVMVSKRYVGGQTEVLVAEDGSEWVVRNPAGASVVVPYVP